MNMHSRLTRICGVGFLALMAGGVAVAQEETFVSYEKFGAVGDGKTDDQAAIVKAHAYANEKGLPVKVADDKTYYIGGGRNPIVIKTDTDFGKAHFIIDDRHVENRGVGVFHVSPSINNIKVEGVTTLKRGQTNIGVKLPYDCIIRAMNAKVKRYIRYGANQNNGQAQTEVFIADRDGNVDMKAPIVWDFDEITSIEAYPMDDKTLTLKGGIFKTIANQAESKYTYYNRGFIIRRSRVVVEDMRHEVEGELDHGAPYSGFLTISQCANVLVRNTVLTGRKMYGTIGSAKVPVNMGSYDISINTAINVTFKDCKQTNDIKDRRYWGILGSNYCKNLTYDGCVFSRFDAHMGVANATIKNSVMGHMGINAIGFGTLLVENTTIYGGSMVNLRSDYGSTWEGEFIFRNCVFVPSAGRKVKAFLVNGSYSGQHDFGYQCYMPRRILFENVRIEDSNHPDVYDGPVIFGDFNRKNTSAEYVEKYPYIKTEEVILRKVTTASGKEVGLSPNPYMFKDVKVIRE